MGKRKRRLELAAAAPAAEPAAERHGYDIAGLGHSSSDYLVNVNEQTALAVDAVFACVRILADLTSDADVGEFRGNERLPDSRLTRRPMATLTRRSWIWYVTATMALYNGCYYRRAFGRDADGVAMSLIPIAPPRVSWLDGRPAIDGVAMDRPDDLAYIPRVTWPTVTRELGTVLRLARDVFAASFAADAYRADFWSNGGAPVVVLTSDQVLDPTQAAEIRDAWATARQAGPGKPAVVGRGAEPRAFGSDLGASGAADATARLGTSVARYFGVPPWLVNVPTEAGSMTYSNASAAGLDLVRYTLRPGYAGPIGDALSDELPGDYLTGRRVRLGLDHLTTGTMLERYQAYQIATGGERWMLPFEVRAELGMPMDMTFASGGAPAPAIESIPAEVPA